MPKKTEYNREICRFAPSVTGPAHPGTILAALLAWLDARSRGAHFILRLEDLDTIRCTPELGHAMIKDLEWLGFDFDEVIWQSTQKEAHEAALDRLAKSDRLYPCSCSRKEIKSHAIRSPDGGFAYPNTCRERKMPSGGWRESSEPLRLRLDDTTLHIIDESGLDLSQNPARAMGDPIVRRRDGAIAYNLAVVVDDEASGVNRIVRGRDIATSTATQLALYKLLDKTAPTWRHHLLLLEERDKKLAKFHGAVGTPELRKVCEAEQIIGRVAYAAGLLKEAKPISPKELLKNFSWAKVAEEDLLMHWDGKKLSSLRP